MTTPAIPNTPAPIQPPLTPFETQLLAVLTRIAVSLEGSGTVLGKMSTAQFFDAKHQGR